MVTAEVVTAYFQGSAITSLVGILGVILLLCFLYLMILGIFGMRNSQQYRKLLSDMYVSGKIRQFADEDNINLDVEEVKFKKWLKSKSIIDKDVDSVVMEELKEKISESNIKKTEKKK